VEGPTNACDNEPPNLMDRGIDRQPSVRIWRTRIVVLSRRIAAIVIGLFLVIQQLLLLLS